MRTFTNKNIVTTLAVAVFALSIGGTAMNASLAASTAPQNLWTDKVLCGILGFCGASTSAIAPTETMKTQEQPPVQLSPSMMSGGTCGDGICQDVVCMAIGCPQPETKQTCAVDCDESKKPGYYDPYFVEPTYPTVMPYVPRRKYNIKQHL